MSDSVFPRRPLSERNPYHLDTYREREIIYFCLQYKGWKRKLNSIGMKGSSNEWSDPTSKEAIERVIFSKNVKIVEDACIKTYPEEWELLLQGITDPDSNWYNFSLMKGMQCGKDKYYNLKHKAYYYISLKDRV